MSTRSVPGWWVLLNLAGASLSFGCVALPGRGPATEAVPVVAHAYDVPDTVEMTTVVHAVEQAFAQTLATRPWTVEGSVRAPLPTRPAPFAVTARRMPLERLGVVTIPEVGCPDSLATVHAWVADRAESSVPHRYTGCIQLYAGAYRVQLIDSELVLNSRSGVTGSADARLKVRSHRLARLAQAFLERVTDAREVTDSDPTASGSADEPVSEQSAGGFASAAGTSRPSFSAGPEPAAASAFRSGSGRDGEALVCLAPRYEAAAVRAEHGGGHVIQVLEPGSVTVAADSVDAGYFRVTTNEGLAGWINRAEVRRLPCPIG